MSSVKKRPRDSYDQTDLQSHTVRLNERITKHQLHNYGSAMDIYDAVARTLLPYWEYNERYKIKIFKQLRIDPPSIPNMAHHVRAQLQTLYNEEKSVNITINGIDMSSGATSVYLESSPHGRTLQILTNVLGIEIRLVTSYIYEEIISVLPNDLLELQPLYIAFNDVSKQFFMLDKPANVKRDNLLQHQQTVDHLIQKYSLIPTVLSPSNVRCLSLFLSIAQMFKSNVADFLDTTALALQIRDATYQQIKSNLDQYEKYLPVNSSNKSTHVDIRRDSQWLVESNYYRYQLERAIVHALAHVLQCNLIIFSSSSSQEQQPEIINADSNHRSSENDQVIVLLKNDSTQRFTSARTTYPINHLFIKKPSETSLDPVYETIDHSSLSETKTKPVSTNTFFSKTKDKFVTAVSKLVDNYGNLPKKQAYVNHLQLRTNNHTTEQSVTTPSNGHKLPSTKRQAPLAEHILRQQDETDYVNNQISDVTYENTTDHSSTPVTTRRSAMPTSTKHSQPSSSSSNKRQLRPVPYKDRQKTVTRMGTTKTTVNAKIFNGVSVEDVDESTTADEANNNEDEYDSFSDEAADEMQSVILKERKKKAANIPKKSSVRPQSGHKSTPYHYDHDALKRQQHQANLSTADEDFYENDRQRDELNRDDDIYLSTSDIVQQDRKQLQLFVNGRATNKQPAVIPTQERKTVTSKLLPTTATTTTTTNDRQSFLIDKDAVLEVLGHNIAQRDRHILMKVLKQEDLISKEWQRLLFLLDEYVNNPKKEKKERGLHALTLMENLDRLGYDMLEIQSTGPNHFKAIAKSILLMIEINDWFSEHICQVLHLNDPNDSRMIRQLRKLCLRDWAKYLDDYRSMFAQHNINQQQQRITLDLPHEIERFRDEDYYRADMYTLVNQALANALAIPIHIVRAVREPNNPLEIYIPMRGIARPGLAIVLIESHPNAGDGHYDVAVLKGHPQTLRKHRNVTFDDKPEVRSFETNPDEQQHATLPSLTLNNNAAIQQQQQQAAMMNPAFMTAHQAQFFPNPYLYSPFAYTTPQLQQVPGSPSVTQPTNPNVSNTNTNANNNNQPKTNITGTTNATIPTATVMLQPQMPYIQMQQAQPTFVYNPLMHTPQQQPTAANPTATFFYTPANYPM